MQDPRETPYQVDGPLNDPDLKLDVPGLPYQENQVAGRTVFPEVRGPQPYRSGSTEDYDEQEVELKRFADIDPKDLASQHFDNQMSQLYTVIQGLKAASGDLRNEYGDIQHVNDISDLLDNALEPWCAQLEELFETFVNSNPSPPLKPQQGNM